MISATEIIAAALWSFGAAATFGYIHNISRYNILWAALAGAAGWALYTAAGSVSGSDLYGYFCGAFCIASLSELFAMLFKNPATVYLVPGLLPLVPGGGMFQTMREAVQGNMEQALRTGFITISAAGAIALGLALASSAARIIILCIRQMKKKRKHPAESARSAADGN